jgi:hypothetical protein
METKTKTTKTKVPVQDKKVIDAHRSLLSKTEASEQQLRKVIAGEVEDIRIQIEELNLRLSGYLDTELFSSAEYLEKQMKKEFTRTFKPVVVLFAITIFLQFAILVN